MTEQVYEAAKDNLESAITAFYATVEPDAYIDSWVLVTHKRSAEWEQRGQSAVGVLSKTGMAFPLRRGMLETALDQDRHPAQGEDDG